MAGMKLALFSLGDLRLVSPLCPKRSKRIIEDYLKKYGYVKEEVGEIDISTSFIEGFYYARVLIGDMLEQERDKQERDKQVGCIYDEPLKPYFCEADWNCKDCPNWRDEKVKANIEADKAESEGQDAISN